MKARIIKFIESERPGRQSIVVGVARRSGLERRTRRRRKEEKIREIEHVGDA